MTDQNQSPDPQPAADAAADAAKDIARAAETTVETAAAESGKAADAAAGSARETMATAFSAGDAWSSRSLEISQGGLEQGMRLMTTSLGSGMALVTGWQQASLEYVNAMQAATQRNLDLVNQIWTARSVDEFAGLQANYMKSMLEIMVGSAARMTEMSWTMASRATEQMSEQAESSVREMRKAAE